MLEFYKCTYYAIINGEKVRGFSGTALYDSNTVKEGEGQIGIISWGCVDGLTKYNFYYTVRNTKKGKILKIFEDRHGIGEVWKFKEWEKNLNILIIEECYKINVSLQQVLDWHDAEKAIQYLKEHGLSINGAI